MPLNRFESHHPDCVYTCQFLNKSGMTKTLTTQCCPFPGQDTRDNIRLRTFQTAVHPVITMMIKICSTWRLKRERDLTKREREDRQKGLI